MGCMVTSPESVLEEQMKKHGASYKAKAAARKKEKEKATTPRKKKKRSKGSTPTGRPDTIRQYSNDRASNTSNDQVSKAEEEANNKNDDETNLGWGDVNEFNRLPKSYSA